MTDVQSTTQETFVPSTIAKALEANLKAEEALSEEPHPNVELAQTWALIAQNWIGLVDPRSPEVRRLTMARKVQ